MTGSHFLPRKRRARAALLTKNGSHFWISLHIARSYSVEEFANTVFENTPCQNNLGWKSVLKACSWIMIVWPSIMGHRRVIVIVKYVGIICRIQFITWFTQIHNYYSSCASIFRFSAPVALIILCSAFSLFFSSVCSIFRAFIYSAVRSSIRVAAASLSDSTNSFNQQFVIVDMPAKFASFE